MRIKTERKVGLKVWELSSFCKALNLVYGPDVLSGSLGSCVVKGIRNRVLTHTLDRYS